MRYVAGALVVGIAVTGVTLPASDGSKAKEPAYFGAASVSFPKAADIWVQAERMMEGYSGEEG